jgi:hypothetical protein
MRKLAERKEREKNEETKKVPYHMVDIKKEIWRQRERNIWRERCERVRERELVLGIHEKKKEESVIETVRKHNKSLIFFWIFFQLMPYLSLSSFSLSLLSHTLCILVFSL